MKASWGEIYLSRKQRRYAFYWIGARIVEVRVTSAVTALTVSRASVDSLSRPQVSVGAVKVDGEGGKPPASKANRTRRKHRRGPRTSRVSRSTGETGRSEVDNPAPSNPRPGAVRRAKARTRFVNWVDRAVNRIKDRLLAEIDMEAWRLWESMDFHPTRVPWMRFDRNLQFYRTPNYVGTYVERECFRVRKRAHKLRDELIARLTSIKGRPPPSLYVENALAVKCRSWMSGGLPFPREGYVPMVELNRPWDGQILRTLRENESVRVCAWCGRTCVASSSASSNQVRCPQGTGCRVWRTRQAQTRRRVPRGPRS
jgi:hypothetical protein